MSATTTLFPMQCPHCDTTLEARRSKTSENQLACDCYAVCSNAQCGAGYLLHSEFTRQVSLSAFQRRVPGLKVSTLRTFTPSSMGV